MPRARLTLVSSQDRVPTFVRRQTAARELDISVDTFDAWLKDGAIPPAAVQRGGIWLWRWGAIVDALDPDQADAPASDPFTEGLANLTEKRTRRRAAP